MGLIAVSTSPPNNERSILLATIVAIATFSLCLVQPAGALQCVQCCSCQGDSQACSASGAPLFTYINKQGMVQCDATSNVCGTIKLVDITNNQPLTLKSCFTANMCTALVRLVGTDIPFFYLGEINTRVISVNCCNQDNCNANSASLNVVLPSTFAIIAVSSLILLLFR